MSRLILMVGRIDDLDNPDVLTEVWRKAMRRINPDSIIAEHYLDGLESSVTTLGWEAMRMLLVEQ